MRRQLRHPVPQEPVADKAGDPQSEGGAVRVHQICSLGLIKNPAMFGGSSLVSRVRSKVLGGASRSCGELLPPE